MAFAPVVVDRSHWRRPFYMSTLARTALFSEVRDIVHPTMANSMAVTIENAWEPMDADDIARPTEGALIRLAPDREPLSPLMDLDESLHRLDWARDVDDYGMPPRLSPEGRTLVITPDFSFVLHIDAFQHIPVTQQEIADLLGAEVDDVVLTLPQEDIDDVSHRGQPVVGAIGAHLTAVQPVGTSWCALFVDARDFAQDIAYRFFSTNRLSIQDLVASVNCSCPSEILPGVEGFEYYEADTGLYVFQHGAVATLSIDPPDYAVIAPDPWNSDRLSEQTDAAGSDPWNGSADMTDVEISSGDHGVVPPSSVHGGQLQETCCTRMDIRLPVTDADNFSDLETCSGGTVLSSASFTDYGAVLVKDVVTLFHGRQSEDKDAKFPLHLADFLPTPAFSIAGDCVRCCSTELFTEWHRLLAPWPPFHRRDIDQGCKLHPATTAALSKLHSGPDVDEVVQVELFTDGSFRNAISAWGVVVLATDSQRRQTLLMHYGGPVVCDTEHPQFLGAVRHDAPTAESTALSWAVLWTISHWQAFPAATFVFRIDNVSCGFAASGDWRTSGCGIAVTARCLSQLLERLAGPHRIVWRHIKGHICDPYNEFADSIARSFTGVQASYFSCPPTSIPPFNLGAHNLVWLHAMPEMYFGVTLPRSTGVGIAISEEPVCTMPVSAQALIPTMGSAWRQNDAVVQLKVRIISANVQSIKNKAKFLDEQFEKLQYDVICLQETKCGEVALQSGNYSRFHSDGEQHWGVAVWISRKRPLFWLGGSPRYVDMDDVTTIAAGPRLLLLTVVVQSTQIIIGSLHFPHQARPLEEQQQFRQQILELLDPWKHLTCLLGCDTNARPADSFGFVTGALRFDEPDEAGHELCVLCQQLGLWIPSTFEQLHSGNSGTWTHRATGKQSRIDVVLLSADLCADSWICSSVRSDVDLLVQGDDHEAVAVEVCTVKRTDAEDRDRLTRPRFNLDKLRDPLVREKVFAALQSISLPDWECDINMHTLHVQEKMLEVLSEMAPALRRGPKTSYISDEAWDLRQRKMQLKSRSWYRKFNFRQVLMGMVLSLMQSPCAAVASAIRKAVLLYEITAAAIACATQRMKSCSTRDKSQALHFLANDFGYLRAGNILTALKRTGIGGRKQKQWRTVLPRLCKDGRNIAGKQALDELWLAHFGQMEVGEELSTERYIYETRCQLANRHHDVTLDAAALPTLLEVEHAIRTMKPGTAPGLDAIPADLLVAAPKQCARLLWPVMLKAATSMVQPIFWRGGILFDAWKRKGPISSPESYRSLFVSSVPGKVYHRVLRRKLMRQTTGAMDPNHHGSSGGSSVLLPSLLVVSHERWGEADNVGTAALFLDVQSAYYRILRQAAYGLDLDGDLDRHVFRVLNAFGLPQSDWQEIIDLVQGGGTIADAGGSQHLRGLIADTHRESFFVSRHSDGSRLVRTLAGSRPGESLADTIFAHVYGRVLRRIREDMDASGISTRVPWTGARSFWPGFEDSQVRLLDTTWADDSTFLLRDDDCGTLLDKLQALTASVVDRMMSFGLVPNLAPGKTEVLLSLRGRGSRKAAARHFMGNKYSLPVRTSRLGAIMLRVVAHYTHLGCIVDRGSTMRPEMRHRAGVANAAFEAGRKLIFQNVRIALETRAGVFASLVENSVFNLGLWTGQEGAAWDSLQACHFRLFRRLVAKQLDPDKFYRLRPADMVLGSRHPPLGILARARRVSLFAAIVRSGSDGLWAVLEQQRGWLEAVAGDLQWLCDTSSGRLPPMTDASWPMWWSLFRERPGCIKGATRRAVRSAMATFVEEQDAVDFERQFVRTAERVVPNFGAPAPCISQWVCGPCQKAFRRKAGLAVHMFKVHGRTAAYRRYAGPTKCPGCGTDFHHYQRILVHIRDTPACARLARAYGFFHGDVRPGLGSQRWRQDRQANPILCPPEPGEVCGAVAAGVRADDGSASFGIDRMAGNVGEALLAMVPCADLDEVRMHVLAVLRSEPMYPDEIMCVLEQSLADVQLCSSEVVLGWTDDDTAMVCGVLRDLLAKFDGACLLLRPQVLEEATLPYRGMDLAFLEAIPMSVRRATRSPASVGSVCLVLGDFLPSAEMTRYLDLSAKTQLTVTTPGSRWASEAEILEAAFVVVCIDALWEGGGSAQWTEMVVPLPLGSESCELFARPIGRRAALQLLHGLWLRSLNGVASSLVLGPRSVGVQRTPFFQALSIFDHDRVAHHSDSWLHFSLQAPLGFTSAN